MSNPLECCGRYKEAVFTYGSNLASRNGKGAALHAKLCHGARPVPHGPSGSRAYAIPTKDARLVTLAPFEIRPHVAAFLTYTRSLPNLTFYVTAIGTGLAGYSHEQIAPMFADAPLNCILPKEWERWTRPNQEEEG